MKEGSRYPPVGVQLAIDIQTSVSSLHRFVRRRDSLLRLFPSLVAHGCQYVSWAVPRWKATGRSLRTIRSTNISIRVLRVCYDSSPPSFPLFRPFRPLALSAARWIADNFVFEMLTPRTIIDANRGRCLRSAFDSPRGKSRVHWNLP